MKKLVLALSIFSCFNVTADSNKISVWQDIGQNAKSITNKIFAKNEMKYRSVLLDESLLKTRLSTQTIDDLSAKGISSKSLNREISLPLPDGSFVIVRATPSQVISKEMAESYPDLKTWNVVAVDDPEITGVIDFTANGFSGMLIMPDGDTIFIDPDKDQAGDVYKSFSKSENLGAFDTKLNCEIHDDHDHKNHLAHTEFAIKTGARALSNSLFPNLSFSGTKTYRLALSGTAEYTASQGGTAGARSSMVTSVNRINPVFTRDLGVSLQLIDAPNLIFTDASAADYPFTNPNNPNTLMRENGNYVSENGLLGSFDIGHVLSHRSSGGGSGVAFLGVACRGDVNTSNLGLLKGLKAAGATTSSNPTGSTFDLVLLAHELGHQLGANHSFNSVQGGNCSGGRTASVAVEPGSGSSIMAYGGLCGSDNLIENPRDDFFHFASISQINSYTRGGNGATCGTSPTGGSIPTANAGADIKIPARTPFLLDGTASSGTASWDQIDIGAASAVNVDTGDNAIIRHNIPSSEQDRYIPSLANLFNGTQTKGEILPTTSRELNFAYVVRNGGVSSDKKLINVTNTGSTFGVVSQPSGQTITTNKNLDVIWNPANTNVAPISCSNVSIQLIRQNGVKNMLLASTPNDGSQSFVVPNATPTMSNARIYVGCSDNSFFNISSGNIIVQKGAASTDTTKPVITIKGANPATIVEGTAYTDEGATATDNVDGTVSVSQSGTVNTNAVGIYTITYTAVDAAGNSQTATRTVNVTAAPQVDNTAPVITLNGASTINIVEGTSYSEAGATALDAVDGTVTVSQTGTVNTNTVGTYTITYTAVDAAGNSNSKTRTVNVTAAPSTPTEPTPTEPTPPTPTPTEPTTPTLTEPTQPTPTTPTQADTTPPIITLTGSPEITLQVGQEFVDSGSSAIDDRDGATAVIVTGLDQLDTSKAGEYVITYTSVDAAGNSQTATRTVIVTADSGQGPINDLSGNGGGGSFGYLLLPLMILLGLRRPKPVRVRANYSNKPNR